MNSEPYQDILNTIVFPTLKEKYHRTLICQQDGASPHYSTIVSFHSDGLDHKGLLNGLLDPRIS